MEEIAYRAQNVRETLVELKNTSELAVDLAYAAALYDYPGLAGEVLELAERASSLQYPAQIALMLAAKRSSDAEELVGIVQIVTAAVTITEAAADIASIVVNDIGLPEGVRRSLPEADEVIMRAEVSEDGKAIGRTFADLALETRAGVSVIALRRQKEWDIAPDADTTLEAGDIVIGSGPDAGVTEARELLTGEPGSSSSSTTSPVEELHRATELVINLKNVAELAVGLGYAAVLFDDVELATEVAGLEARSDAINHEIETLVIEAGDRVADPGRLRGLLHLATASEVICDAALDMAEIVLREGDVHPVFAQAVRESDELIMTMTVEAGSRVIDATLAEVEIEEHTGMLIMAIHRDPEWILAPGGETRLRADDLLIARGPEAGARQLQAWTTR